MNIQPGTRFTAYVDRDVKIDRVSAEAASPPPEVKHVGASVFIYRGNQDKAPGTALPVSCGRFSLGGLTDSTFVKLDVAPGRYWFYTNVPATKLSASQQQNQMVALDVAGGKTYYLEVAFGQGKWKTLTPTIRQANELVGSEEVFKAEAGANAVLPATGTKEFANLSAKPKGVKSN